MTEDPIDALVHDHADINRRVLEVGRLLAGHGDANQHVDVKLVDLREELFLHFAREEEGLFPFVTERFAELAGAVEQMETAHDTICGVVARMCHVVASANVATMRSLFERFEVTYAQHAKLEAALLAQLAGRLDEADCAKLAQLVRDL